MLKINCVIKSSFSTQFHFHTLHGHAEEAVQSDERWAVAADRRRRCSGRRRSGQTVPLIAADRATAGQRDL